MAVSSQLEVVCLSTALIVESVAAGNMINVDLPGFTSHAIRRLLNSR